MTTPKIRQVLSAHIGKVLTPELACEIELTVTCGMDRLALAAPQPSVGDMRSKVTHLENSMQGLEPANCPITHHFAPGMYAREIFIPKGTVLVGAIHKTDNLVVLSKGALELVTETGTTVITAPHTLICKAGSKNAALAIEDSVWTNFFPTEETDPNKLVELLTESTADELLGGSSNPQRLSFIARQSLE